MLITFFFQFTYVLTKVVLTCTLYNLIFLNDTMPDLDICTYIYVITISKSINTCMFYCSLYTNCMQHAICCYTYYICRSQERIAHKSFNAVNWGMWYRTENNWICSQSDKLAKHSSTPWSHFFYYDKRRNGKGYPFANGSANGPASNHIYLVTIMCLTVDTSFIFTKKNIVAKWFLISITLR